MKSRFCTNELGVLVDIQDLSPEARDAQGPYVCLGCGQAMVPVMGSIRIHHFRHRSDTEVPCSLESYLHRAAKLAVVQGFRSAHTSGRPYTLTRNRRIRCMAAEAIFPGGCSKPDAPEAFDLTRWLDEASEEVGIGGFVADVLLTKRGQQVQLLVEIEVTHPCEQEKLASGLPIAEVKVISETDIEDLLRGITIDCDRGQGFNLSSLAERKTKTCSECPHEETAFIIHRSGKLQMASQTRRRLSGMLRRGSVLHWEIVTGKHIRYRPVERIETFLEEAHFGKGIPARSCLLCRFGAISFSMKQPMVCFKQQGVTTPIGINDAVGCLEYSPVQTHADLISMRRQHAARRGPSHDLYVDAYEEDNLIED
jgi:hypothetical protein